MTRDRLRIGSGAGFSGDRIEPALELVEKGDLDYLAFECLAERTIALAQLARLRDPDAGFDPLLTARMQAVLPAARAKGVRIVTNMGAANPLGAAKEVNRVARELGLNGLHTAAVMGDDVLDLIRDGDFPLTDRDGSSRDLGDAIISANAYLGADGIVEALDNGADVVVTGRVGDPALFLGPLVHSFGWARDDWSRLGQGTLVGHLLECAGQVTGGYFADPGFKDVPDLAQLGFPFADVTSDGIATLGKVTGSGGRLTGATCKEQLLYEILDPAAYYQADVIADFTGAMVEDLGEDRVRISGGTGKQRSDTLKVSIGYRDGFIGEGQISYAGPGAEARARLALEIARERLSLTGAQVSDLRLDLIGVDASNRTDDKRNRPELREVRARLSGRAASQSQAERIGAEIEALYTNGPSGGGGVTRSVREVIAVASTLIDRDTVRPHVQILEA
ncbi:MAG TPA: acyclic terpene utilization AtuA family protein [Sphingobium sp.]|uniref:acyclic terpene utilization AtuA family protein n=1 Tax=Sphingobium sp. TaxID=1912891 RepID=UPI002ED2D8AF